MTPVLPPRLKHWMASHGRPLLETAALGFCAAGASRRAFSRAPDGAFRVLAYHQTERRRAERFRRQMEWLASNRRVVSLGGLVETIGRGEEPTRGSVAVTFDDGFANNFETAAPILKQLGLPACFFVATDFIDLAGQGNSALKKWGERVYRFTRVAEPMTWGQVRSLVEAGFEIGVHTRSHADLGKLSDEAVREEISQSFERISQEIGVAPNLFAYPYGKTPMAPPAARRVAMRSAPFRAAFSTERGWNTSSTPRDWLRRDSMEPAFSPRLLEAFLSGMFDH
ncbi:polysaccharide deacetylase family protein [Candidatus Sumerlaeota bacterium]|nr:polysaccharide deacetylase family protein [Candidatus Sumerlaeota bacterium]